VVNMGILESLGIPFQDGMRAFQSVLGERLAYFPAPDFGDTTPVLASAWRRNWSAK
jgi:hypothetical protein